MLHYCGVGQGIYMYVYMDQITERPVKTQWILMSQYLQEIPKNVVYFNHKRSDLPRFFFCPPPNVTPFLPQVWTFFFFLLVLRSGPFYLWSGVHLMVRAISDSDPPVSTMHFVMGLRIQGKHFNVARSLHKWKPPPDNMTSPTNVVSAWPWEMCVANENTRILQHNTKVVPRKWVIGTFLS